MDWFSVDKEGLAMLLEEKGKAFVFGELLQNAWDADECSTVNLTVEPVPNSPSVDVVIEDDAPDGFADLTHAFTLFAPSTKKEDPTKRGRFNLGEKLVLALCSDASIVSTKGAYRFDKHGRTTLRRRRERGSQFVGRMKITRAEMNEALAMIKRMQVPPAIETRVHFADEDFVMSRREPLASFEESLQTLKGNTLRTTYRKTKIDVLDPAIPGEGWIYEMGIPVCRTGDRWDVDVHQRVPMDLERRNVPYGYLFSIRAKVLNAMASELTTDEASEEWVSEGLHSCDEEAVKTVIAKRYGDKVASYDPNDPEASATAVAKGYMVLHGGSLSKGEWGAVRRAGAVASAGRLFPTGGVKFDPEGSPPLRIDQLPEGAERFLAYVKGFAQDALDMDIRASIYADLPGAVACYGQRHISFSLRKLGKRYFERFPDNREDVDELLIHEFAHEIEANHLSHKYHEACCRIGAKVRTASLNDWSIADRRLADMGAIS